MLENRKFWKCQVVAERLCSYATSIAMEAAFYDSKAFAVVADETERLGTELLDLVERASFDDLPPGPVEEKLRDITEQLELLGTNSAIECFKSRDGAGVALCADGIRRTAFELQRVRGLPEADTGIPPEPAVPGTATGAREFLLAFEVGGMRFIEGLRFVREILRFDPEGVGNGAIGESSGREGRRFNLRGRSLPLVDVRARLGLPAPREEEGRRILVVNGRWSGSEGREYAAVIDRVEAGAIFKSPLGIATAPRGLGFPTECIRECWDAVDGSQFLFLDWRKLAD